MIVWTHGLINRLVRLGDLVALTAASAFSWTLAWPEPVPLNILQSLFLLALVLALFNRAVMEMNAYRVEHYRNAVRTMVEPLVALALSTLAAAFLIVIFMPAAFAQPAPFLAWEMWMALFLFGHRMIARVLVARAFRNALLRRRVAIIGVIDRTNEMVQSLIDPSQHNTYELVGIYDDRGPDRRPETVAGVAVTGTVDDLREAVRDGRVDMVVIALPWTAAIRIQQMLERLQGFSADVLIPFEGDDFRLNFSNVVRVAGMPSLQVAHRPLKGSQGLLKIAEDKAVAALGLLLASPLLLAVAIAIKLDSPGPVLFRQPRVGFNNKNFDCFKFRTMTVDPNDDGTRGTTRDNPRITRIGKFLRRSSIDELPQLMNVLRGDMSIVGPRPHVPNMLIGNHTYLEAVREYAYRCRVKPGITGWAQINGGRGTITTVDKAKRVVAYDIFYIENWSLWLDIKIMVRTLVAGMFGKDAY
ncbi:undecaprenyl-phosphate glucose phosphotransferase [Zavarzinia compransoris]|uniref:undecaprenyl-phosphate glucose phosphotransferase n=1 Tax=Zavarzinia marina TaxID=2911065 RepID=UPI001F2B3F3A|nr:undecaprenyl-phosphate glucose phosphotransferase [Zavarzinia marina]MCF4165091.1 undecaprenyl-phosphate glucose phosphotransferase [Zavarzinia marina]